MEILAALGGGSFVLASLVLGIRLMWLARSTRGFPEFILGLALFLMGALGYPLMAIALQGTGLPMGVRTGLLVLQMGLGTVGMTGIALFTRRVFRPTGLVSRLAVPLVGLGYALSIALQGAGPGYAAYIADPHGPFWWTSFVGIAVMAWTGCESLRYHVLMRRRLRIGLADPVVTDRFRLWSIAMFAAATISGTGIVLDLVFGIAVNGTAAGHLLVGSLGTLISGSLWLAFLPPERYLDWVRRRAVASPA